jgi:hypothetical protein
MRVVNAATLKTQSISRSEKDPSVPEAVEP